MDIHLLNIFIMIAEEKSLTRAASRLHYVQSNISARLRQLEEELECNLFTRTKKGMLLTTSGQKLLPMAKELVAKQEEVLQQMKEVTLADHLTLGVPDTFMRTYLPKPLHHWKKDHPDTQLKVKTGYSHQVVEWLEEETIDVGVIISRKKPQGFHLIREIKSELCVVTPKEVDSLDYKNLHNLQPMLLGDSCFFGQSLLGMLNDLGIVTPKHEFLFSIETILQCVSLGLGITVFPRCLMDAHPMASDLQIHKFPGKKNFSFHKVCLKHRFNEELIEGILTYL